MNIIKDNIIVETLSNCTDAKVIRLIGEGHHPRKRSLEIIDPQNGTKVCLDNMIHIRGLFVHLMKWMKKEEHDKVHMYIKFLESEDEW